VTSLPTTCLRPGAWRTLGASSIDASITQNMTARKLQKPVAKFVTRQCSLQTSKTHTTYLSLLDSRRILSMFPWLYRVSLKRDRSSSMQRLLPMKSKLGVCANERTKLLPSLLDTAVAMRFCRGADAVFNQIFLSSGHRTQVCTPYILHLHHAWDHELPIKPIHLHFSKASYTRGQ
jgi:hypothetical protein